MDDAAGAARERERVDNAARYPHFNAAIATSASL